MRNRYLYTLYVLIVFALGACRPETSEQVPPANELDLPKIGSIDAVPRGNITGFVTLFDEFGVQKPDNAGMIVSLEGLQTAFPSTTRSEGRFTISNAFAGLYNLSYRKEGYGNFKRIAINHTGGSVPTVAAPVDVWETPRTVPSNLAVSVKGFDLTFTGMAAPVQPAGADTTQQRRIRLFFGRDENVSQFKYVSSLSQYRVPPGGQGAFTIKLSADDLLAFKPGERVYAVAYGITAKENAYVDPDTKLTVYSGTNPKPSNVVNFVLP